MITHMLKAEDVTNAIIFCNRKTTVRDLNKTLQKSGVRSGEIHGDMDQGSRIAELDRFKRGDVNVLVASDVAARGLDIKGVSHVFNMTRPGILTTMSIASVAPAAPAQRALPTPSSRRKTPKRWTISRN